jgi:hypothetical protein
MQSLGATYARKLFFGKMMLLLAGALRCAEMESVWYGRGVALVAILIVAGTRMIEVKNALNKPLFQYLGVAKSPRSGDSRVLEAVLARWWISGSVYSRVESRICGLRETIKELQTAEQQVVIIAGIWPGLD